MATRLQTPELPDWEAQLRQQGFSVRHAVPGYTFEPVHDRPKQGKRIGRLLRRAVRRVFRKRGLP